MSGQNRVRYDLDAGEIKSLPQDEIKMILRGADELITTGGRSMLAKILKGSKDKKVLEYKLDNCPAYGLYNHLTLVEIGKRIHFLILKKYLRIEYSGRLPMLVFTDRGWEIERKTYTEEWYQRFVDAVTTKIIRIDMFEELKTVNRLVVFDLLDMLGESGNGEI